MEYKESTNESLPFHRLSVKEKKELIRLNRPEADPNVCKGTYLEPCKWNELLQDPDVVLLDTRNDYEVSIGKFKNAIDPKTKSFTQFPEFVESHKSEWEGKKIAMYCTGGIRFVDYEIEKDRNCSVNRCEKASSYMIQNGFPEVYHLKGGILKYLETISQDESLWEGNCFVFDQRVSVGHGLRPSGHKLCYACRIPLSSEEQVDEYYEEGVQCRYCWENLQEKTKEANRERQHQIKLASQRYENHVGMATDHIREARSIKKKARQQQRDREQLRLQDQRGVCPTKSQNSCANFSS